MAYYGCNDSRALNYQVNTTQDNTFDTCGGSNPDSTGLCGLTLDYDPHKIIGYDCNSLGLCSDTYGTSKYPFYTYPDESQQNCCCIYTIPNPPGTTLFDISDFFDQMTIWGFRSDWRGSTYGSSQPYAGDPALTALMYAESNEIFLDSEGIPHHYLFDIKTDGFTENNYPTDEERLGCFDRNYQYEEGISPCSCRDMSPSDLLIFVFTPDSGTGLGMYGYDCTSSWNDGPTEDPCCSEWFDLGGAWSGLSGHGQNCVAIENLKSFLGDYPVGTCFPADSMMPDPICPNNYTAGILPPPLHRLEIEQLDFTLGISSGNEADLPEPCYEWAQESDFYNDTLNDCPESGSPWCDVQCVEAPGGEYGFWFTGRYLTSEPIVGQSICSQYPNETECTSTPGGGDSGCVWAEECICGAGGIGRSECIDQANEFVMSTKTMRWCNNRAPSATWGNDLPEVNHCMGTSDSDFFPVLNYGGVPVSSCDCEGGFNMLQMDPYSENGMPIDCFFSFDTGNQDTAYAYAYTLPIGDSEVDGQDGWGNPVGKIDSTSADDQLIDLTSQGGRLIFPELTLASIVDLDIGYDGDILDLELGDIEWDPSVMEMVNGKGYAFGFYVRDREMGFEDWWNGTPNAGVNTSNWKNRWMLAQDDIPSLYGDISEEFAGWGGTSCPDVATCCGWRNTTGNQNDDINNLLTGIHIFSNQEDLLSDYNHLDGDGKSEWHHCYQEFDTDLWAMSQFGCQRQSTADIAFDGTNNVFNNVRYQCAREGDGMRCWVAFLPQLNASGNFDITVRLVDNGCPSYDINTVYESCENLGPSSPFYKDSICAPSAIDLVIPIEITPVPSEPIAEIGKNGNGYTCQPPFP